MYVRSVFLIPTAEENNMAGIRSYHLFSSQFNAALTNVIRYVQCHVAVKINYMSTSKTT